MIASLQFWDAHFASAAQLDHDNDGFLHMEELSKALADCKISIEADTLERLIQREGLLDKKVVYKPF